MGYQAILHKPSITLACRTLWARSTGFPGTGAANEENCPSGYRPLAAFPYRYRASNRLFTWCSGATRLNGSGSMPLTRHLHYLNQAKTDPGTTMSTQEADRVFFPGP